MSTPSHASPVTLALLSLGCLALLMSGCANWNANALRRQYIYDQTMKEIYPIPCEQVIPSIRKELFDRGYSVKTVDPGSLSIETEWRLVRSDSVSSRDRYLAQALRPDAQRCQINLSYSSSSSDGSISSSRDLELEWLILQQLDPENAQRIIARADEIYFANGGK